ncbi:metal-binding protein [Paenibacillus sp. FSL H7-0326]|uniref:MBL fold metallo-hydrolase n=1 Tax=Paenibacillus sp. FSL H7-0326 TaxID=1921144 RepID=UPI00096FEB5B|nr:MBL fold metallo-hydrolase [Paenibacillus sp. FSL H7-0326]OMC64095.1 metal-binding protein [Paenibacillus sp. FSL H7-0326]
MLNIRTFSLGPLQTNAYLVQGEDSGKAFIIDPGMNPASLIRAIEDLEIEAILLTHAHFDHIGGVEEIRKLKGCPVYVHTAEAEWLTSAKWNGSLRWLELGGEITASPAEYDLAAGMKLDLVGQTFHVYHTPGHSPGSVSLLCGKDLFAGDVLFRAGVGRTDLPGGSERELIHSIQNTLYTLEDDVKVYPGHGPRTTIGFEKQNNPYVRPGR